MNNYSEPGQNEIRIDNSLENYETPENATSNSGDNDNTELKNLHLQIRNYLPHKASWQRLWELTHKKVLSCEDISDMKSELKTIKILLDHLPNRFYTTDDI